ncbi:archaeosortase/exosortase family protein [Segetibacter sp. 3557_3]|uniref:archaeosortase/exosortase family protein n=1 Tax=Segetibacter sp. 3557_3 TaxID=2547429 RepID=UPI001404E1AF|nr:archaeosortase/exosortase family protein [Segetibacter sp. 3557_3]
MSTGVKREQIQAVTRFVVIFSALVIGWQILNPFIHRLDPWLTLQSAKGSNVLINLLGYKAFLKGTIVNVNGLDVVFVDHPCNGLVLFAQFAGLIIALPGSAAKKVWFIPVGIMIIHVLNLVRISALALNAVYDYRSLSFNHHYLFNIIAYSLIFVLWSVWLNRYSGIMQGTGALSRVHLSTTTDL